MPGIDFEDAKRRGLALVQGWLPGGRRAGDEWIARNPTRPDEHLGSFKVNLTSGIWSDFATGDSGRDAVSLLAYLRGLGQAEAARLILSDSGDPAGGNGNGRRERPPAWVLPIPTDREAEVHAAARADWTRERYGAWAASWEYRDAAGRLLSIRARYDQADGKQVIPFGLRADGPAAGDPCKGRTAPLYNLPDLAAAPADAPALLVEGEHCADVAADYLLDAELPHVGTTWPGGSKAKKAAIDWGPLRGRRVLLWPDKDEPGRQAMKEIVELLRPLGCKIATVEPPAELTEGGDVVDLNDEGWSAARIRELLEGASPEEFHQPEELPEPKEKKKYEVMTIADILKAPPVEWLIEDVLFDRTFSILGGYTGFGKSILAMTIAKSIADGFPLFGRYKVLKTGPVLFVDEENSHSDLRDRMIKMKIAEDLLFSFLSFQGVRLDDNESILRLTETIKEINPVLIIFDSLLRFHRENENDAAGMSKVLGKIREMVNAGFGCLVIHHHGKALNALELRARGSSDIVGICDVEYALYRDRDQDLTLQSVKSRRAPIAPMKLRIEEIEDELLVSCLGTAQEQKTQILGAILDFLSDRRAGVSDIKDYLANTGTVLSDRNVRKAVADLLESGKIKTKTGGHNKAEYFVE